MAAAAAAGVVAVAMEAASLLRGTIVNRTYGKHKTLNISLFLLAIFGPIYYGPPS